MDETKSFPASVCPYCTKYFAKYKFRNCLSQFIYERMDISMRTILIAVFLFFFFLVSLLLFPIEWIVGKISPRAKSVSSLRIVQWAFKVILFLGGIKTTVIGFENIPKDEPVLFVGNHRSFFDIIISYAKMQNLTGYIAKKEIEKVPILRTWMRYLNCLFLDRNNIKEGMKTILTGIESLKSGISLVIFPEGTRNKGEGIGDFHAGSFKLAEKAGCKIIPMVQTHTNCCFEDQFPWVKKSRTVLEFGAPIDVSALSREQRKALPAYTHNIMLSIYSKNNAM